MPAPEPLVYCSVSEYERLARAHNFIAATDWSRECSALWSRLPPLTRRTWCHAACIAGEHCLSDWRALSLEEKTALCVALENMKEFFQAAGA